MPDRRDVIKWAAAAPTLVPALAMMAGAAGSLPNAVMDERSATLTHEAFGDLRVYFDGATAQLKSLTAGSLRLKPGMSPHPPHQHPEEEIMVVTEGSGEISVEGKVTKVASGGIMFCGAGKLHGIVNTGKSPLLFYYWKWQA